MFLALKKKKQLDFVENSNQDTSFPDKQTRKNSDSFNLEFEEEGFDDNILGGSLEPQDYHSHYEFVDSRKSLKVQWIHTLLYFALPDEVAEDLLVKDFYPKRIALRQQTTPKWKILFFDFFWFIKQIVKVIGVKKKNYI